MESAGENDDLGLLSEDGVEATANGGDDGELTGEEHKKARIAFPR